MPGKKWGQALLSDFYGEKKLLIATEKQNPGSLLATGVQILEREKGFEPSTFSLGS